ncbi:hypothetical protein Tco_0615492 [Tanacetum coccineum]
MHQPWRTFATIINRSLSGKTSGLDKLRLSRAQILWGMYYKKNMDYVELLWEDFTYQIDNRGHKKQEKIPEMQETKAYKTYLGYATGVTPPKKTRKFTKPTSPKLTIVPVSPEEPTRKSKRYEEVYKKSLRDFNKTHPSGSGIVTSVAKIKPFVTNEGNGAKPGVPDDSSSEGSDQESDNGDDNTQSDNEKRLDSEHEIDENETGSESDQEENEEEVEDDEEEKDDEFVKTPSNYTDDEDETNVESKVEDKAEVNTNEEFIQKEGTDTKMINVQQGNENLEITLNQVIEDAHATISTIAKKTKVPVTSSSHSSDLASKFLKFSDIPHTDAEIVSPMDVHVHHEKDVAELKKDDLINTQVTALVDEHLDSRLGATKDKFMSYLSASITARIIKQVKIHPPQILPKEVSNFAPPMIKSMVTELLEHAVLAKESSQPQSTYEAASLLTEFELKKILIDKMDESQSYLTAAEHRECYDGLIKSYDLDKSLFPTYDKVYSLKRIRKDKDKDEDPSTGSDRGLKKRKTSKDA